MNLVKDTKISWVILTLPGINRALESDLVDPDVEEKIDACL